ncbi:MAG: VCBS repeat-containing protein [Saprospiraceae bacterium]|nr:VCBS repeat-containing protein [Saprospiraceae bacterium]
MKSIYSLLLLGFLCSLYTCSQDSAKQVDPDELEGEALARYACGNCHSYPRPDLLPKIGWENVIPHMAHRLGMDPQTYNPYASKSIEESFRLESSGIYPSSPTLSDSAWQKLLDFYRAHSADSFELVTPNLYPNPALFRPRLIELDLTNQPVLTLLEIDQEKGGIYYGDASGNLAKLDTAFQRRQYAKLPSPVVDVELGANKNDLYLLNIGLLNPNDIETGGVVSTDDSRFAPLQLLKQNLARPVAMVAAKIDTDEQEDLVIAHFGNKFGRLSWYKLEKGEWQERIIKEEAGMSKIIVEDVDQDGDNDLVVLRSHGNEGVSVFINKKGTFTERSLLELPPIYGTSDLEYVDMNGDGQKDLVIASGDNGDNTNLLKPYHGIRIFLKEGEEYKASYFQAMYGATKVRVRDFDEDGDMDIFASAFYSDYSKPEHTSLLYLENQGDLQFKPQHFAEGKAGRWIVADAGDFDQDGDQDILVGSFVQGIVSIDYTTLEAWRSDPKHLLFLENQLK